MCYNAMQYIKMSKQPYKAPYYLPKYLLQSFTNIRYNVYAGTFYLFSKRLKGILHLEKETWVGCTPTENTVILPKSLDGARCGFS